MAVSGSLAAALATGGLVNNSDFCGAPWTAVTGLCQTVPPGAPVGGCINANPMFLAPSPPNLDLTGGAGGCAACASACVDAGNSTAPFLPVTDANGAPRNVNLLGVVPPFGPDMGAIEKQACTP